MATIFNTPSVTWKASVRRKGYTALINNFKSRKDACKWAKSVESDMDRGLLLIGQRLTE